MILELRVELWEVYSLGFGFRVLVRLYQTSIRNARGELGFGVWA